MKKLALLSAITCLSLCTAITSFAGIWKSDANGWWYLNDDGSYPTNGWYWIDGNNDGVAESYYFNENGYCLINTVTPDGYTVDVNGAWTVDGIVQTQISTPSSYTPEITATTSAETVNTSSSVAYTGISDTWFDECTIIVNTNTMKYHHLTCRSVKTIKPHNMGYSNDLDTLHAWGYVGCKICH